MTFDLIIKGGWVIDGTGGPPYRADVGLLDSMIAEVGRLDGAEPRAVPRCDGTVRRPRLHRCPRPRRSHASGRPDPSPRPATGYDHLHHRPGRQLVRPGLARHARLHAPVYGRLQRQPARPVLRLADRGRVPGPLRPIDRDQRRLPDPQRQHPDGGHGAGPSPRDRATRSARCRSSSARAWTPGRSGSPRAWITSRASMPTPARSPRSASRSSRRTASTSPTCGATARRPTSACARSTRSPGRPASRPMSRTTTARPTSCSP